MISTMHYAYIPQHDVVEPNLKKSPIEMEYGVWKVLSCHVVLPTILKNIRLCSRVEKYRETLLWKVKTLNGQKYFHNK